MKHGLGFRLATVTTGSILVILSSAISAVGSESNPDNGPDIVRELPSGTHHQQRKFDRRSKATRRGAQNRCVLHHTRYKTMRNCSRHSSRITGVVKGMITWRYTTRGYGPGTGYVSLRLNDRRGAGCNAARIRYRGGTAGPGTMARVVCRGRAKLFNMHMNNQRNPHKDGVYLVDHCKYRKRWHRLRSCITIWSQRVAQRAP